MTTCFGQSRPSSGFQALVSINMFGPTGYKFDIIRTVVLMHGNTKL